MKLTKQQIEFLLEMFKMSSFNGQILDMAYKTKETLMDMLRGIGMEDLNE